MPMDVSKFKHMLPAIPYSSLLAVVMFHMLVRLNLCSKGNKHGLPTNGVIDQKYDFYGELWWRRNNDKDT